MSARSWTPRIVGGTDYPHANENSKEAPDQDFGPLNFIFNPSEELVQTTYAGLCEIMNAEPRGSRKSWKYGPILDIDDNGTKVSGQCVVEYYGELKTKTYWVPS